MISPWISRLHLAEDSGLAQQILRVQHAAYAMEAKLIRFTAIPPLHENLEDIQSRELKWVGLTFGAANPDQVIAVAAYDEETPRHLDIDRFYVDPKYQRRGFGRLLLSHMQFDALKVNISTPKLNVPALDLYRSMNFQIVGERQIVPELSIIEFQWRA